MKAALRLLLAPYRFSVDRLFRMGEVGGAHWFDSPSLYPGGNHLYLYKDSAGTTPVTAVGDTIGLSLDRAFGGRTDGSLIASGATGLTGTATAASYNTSTGAGSVSRAGDASNQSWVSWTGLTTSAIHRIRITNTGATSLDVRNGSVSGTIVASIAAGATSYVHPLTSGGSTSITITATNNSTTATFTVLEFCRVPGTHLIQATGTARPTLSARVNLLLATEGIAGSASWLTTNTTKTDGIAGAPDGTATATRLAMGGLETDRLQFVATNPAGVTNALFRHSIWVKSESGGLTIRFGESGALDTIAITTEWTRIEANKTTSALVFTLRNEAGGGAKSLLVWHPDCRTADDAAKNIPVYQRVGATAADHDTDGFPHYALFDGTDDSWASAATVDGSGSDKVTLVAGVTKNSDAAAGVVIETTTSWSGNAGTLILSASGAGASWGFGVRGSTGAGLDPTGYPAPATAVLTGIGDIPADDVRLFVNAQLAASSTSDRGTGNFANATLYVGSRAGTSLRFNGRLYSFVFRFGAMGEADRNRSEQWNKNLMRLP